MGMCHCVYESSLCVCETESRVGGWGVGSLLCKSGKSIGQWVISGGCV